MEQKSNLIRLDSFELESINGGEVIVSLINISLNNVNSNVHTEDTLKFPIKVGSLLISLFSGLKSYTAH